MAVIGGATKRERVKATAHLFPLNQAEADPKGFFCHLQLGSWMDCSQTEQT